jgi:hypothetical protein
MKRESSEAHRAWEEEARGVANRGEMNRGLCEQRNPHAAGERSM